MIWIYQPLFSISPTISIYFLTFPNDTFTPILHPQSSLCAAFFSPITKLLESAHPKNISLSPLPSLANTTLSRFSKVWSKFPTSTFQPTDTLTSDLCFHGILDAFFQTTSIRLLEGQQVWGVCVCACVFVFLILLHVYSIWYCVLCFIVETLFALWHHTFLSLAASLTQTQSE